MTTTMTQDASGDDSRSIKRDALFVREYIGVAPPPGVHLPTADEIRDLCDDHPRSHVLYPAESPVFWTKYGSSVFWNEVSAQSMAHRELLRRNSSARAPAVYYAFQYNYTIYSVMEYIQGKTAEEALKELDSQAKAGEDEGKRTKEDSHQEAMNGILEKVALGLNELHRIPIPPGQRPAAVSGGPIRHCLFDEQEVPRHYESVDHLELHLNTFLERTRKKARLSQLSSEPLVFCFSDIYPSNFIIDPPGSRATVTVIDFADASILPSSFARYSSYDNKFYAYTEQLSRLVHAPVTDGVDNRAALCAVMGPLVFASASFGSIGRRTLGGDDASQKQIEESIKTERWPNYVP